MGMGSCYNLCCGDGKKLCGCHLPVLTGAMPTRSHKVQSISKHTLLFHLNIPITASVLRNIRVVIPPLSLSLCDCLWWCGEHLSASLLSIIPRCIRLQEPMAAAGRGGSDGDLGLPLFLSRAVTTIPPIAIWWKYKNHCIFENARPLRRITKLDHHPDFGQTNI